MITQKRKEYQKKYKLENKETLKKCRKEYNLKNKETLKKYQKKYKLENKEKIKEYHKEYHKEYLLKNKETLKKYQKEYCLKNKKHIAKYKKEYYLKNKKYIAKVELNYKREQSKNNPNFRLKSNLRSRVYSALKGSVKSVSTMELIGCSVDQLWNHLESKFESWMTRENYGLWHVDHKIACAKFDLTCPEQQRICFNYKNLQPMEATENMRKGAR